MLYSTGRRYRARRTRSRWSISSRENTAMPLILYPPPAPLSRRQSLGCVGGLDQNLGRARVSTAISVRRIEMEFPNDIDPIASQEIECHPFMEDAIELLHGLDLPV